MVNKKGLSDIVTTVFIIVLVIVAIVLMWAFVRPAIERAGSTVGTLGYSVGLSIDENTIAYSTSPASLSFRVTRNADQGTMTAINVIVEDNTGASKVIKKETTLGELASTNIALTSEDLAGLSTITKLSVAPILLTEEGVEFTAPVSDEKEVTIGGSTPPAACPGVCTPSATQSCTVGAQSGTQTCSSSCAWGTCVVGTVTQCNDGIDNEALSAGGASGTGGGDGWIDAKDPGCWTNPTNPATYSAADNSESFVMAGCSGSTPAVGCCANEADSPDSDTLLDGNDLGCSDALDTTETSQCEDTTDNDGDTKNNFPNDYGCSSLADNSEVSAAECYETDGGLIPATAGTTTLYTSLSPTPTAQMDTCISSTQLREYHCNTAHTAILNTVIACSSTCSTSGTGSSCTATH